MHLIHCETSFSVVVVVVISLYLFFLSFVSKEQVYYLSENNVTSEVFENGFRKSCCPTFGQISQRLY